MELLLSFLIALELISGSGEDYTDEQLITIAGDNDELLYEEYGDEYLEDIESIDQTDTE